MFLDLSDFIGRLCSFPFEGTPISPSHHFFFLAQWHNIYSGLLSSPYSPTSINTAQLSAIKHSHLKSATVERPFGQVLDSHAHWQKKESEKHSWAQHRKAILRCSLCALGLHEKKINPTKF